MPSMLHAPLISPGFSHFNHKAGERLASAFTAVNGRTSPPCPPSPPSPPSPARLDGINAMTTSNTSLSRPVCRQSPDCLQDSKPPILNGDSWTAPHAPIDTLQRNHHPPAHQTSHASSTSPTTPRRNGSPTSPCKRKRSTSLEARRPHSSPDDASGQRRRLDAQASISMVDSPNTIAQVQRLVMEHPHPRTLPPVDRINTETRWPSSRDAPYTSHHESQPRIRDLIHTTESNTHQNNTNQVEPSTADSPPGFDSSSTTQITKAGVHVDPKKRKRQFANRTKTGCGTCRRRKKKCDEMKPECNNCKRGGFICEGYAMRVPWPKNGTPKPQLPLQAKDRFPVDPTQLYNSHGPPRESYHESSPTSANDGGRGRPIIVEENDHAPARSTWTNGWGDAATPRSAYLQEQMPSQAEYMQGPPKPSYGHPPPSEHQASHSAAALPMPPPRQHTSRKYHYTQESMAKRLGSKGPPPPNELTSSQQPAIISHAAGPAGPPPAHYAPPAPRLERSEKEKMLNEEPFYPFDSQLVQEREKCRAEVYRFNNVDNPRMIISDEECIRNFRSILLTSWPSGLHGPSRSGHLGSGFRISPRFECTYGYNIHIGSHVEIGPGCTFLDSGDVSIGDHAHIGANVTINTIKTPTETRSNKGTSPHRTSIALKVHIGKNVYIEPNCIIQAGVSIGDNATILAGSVVIRDIPADSRARGNPAEFI